MLLESQKVSRCQACVKHRKLLCTMAARTSKYDGTNPSSHTTYANLNSAQKDMRLRNMQKELIKFRQRNECLKKKIDESIRRVGVTVDNVLHDEKETEKVHAAYPEESFQRLF